MLIVDVTKGVRSHESAREQIKAYDEATTTLLERLVSAAERLPEASPLRHVLQLQARQLMSFFGLQEVERYRAIAAENASQS